MQSDAGTDHQREGQAFALAPVQGNRHVRRGGLHAGGLVGRQGDLYFKSKDIAVGHILPVIELRLAALSGKGLPDDACLAFPGQKVIQDSLYATWHASEDGKDSLKRVQSRVSSKEALSRNMKSQRSVVAYKKFGGLPLDAHPHRLGVSASCLPVLLAPVMLAPLPHRRGTPQTNGQFSFTGSFCLAGTCRG